MSRLFFLIFSLTLFSSIDLLSNESRILRYPNASQNEITFCHGGDVFVVPISGGIARRITSSEGIEMYPRFSTDGSKIAFTGEYDGNREIYIIPAIGGTPVRKTYSMDIPNLPDRMGPDKIIMQWVNSDNEILYRSRQESWNAWVGKLYTFSIDGGLPNQVEVPVSGFASFSPDASKMAYNRIFREYRTWKRYKGGQADDIWIYDFKQKSLKNITNNSAQDIIPIWHGEKIFYLSDRDKIMNIFVYNTKTKETKKVTNFDEYDVKFPSWGSKYIAFENGGYIYLLDPITETTQKVNITVSEDFPDSRTSIIDVKNNIRSFEISPQGNRALFTSRGDIFTVPASKGNILNLTKSSGVHERNAVWSPDGKWIAYISDKSGENNIYIVKPDGSDEIKLTNIEKSYIFEIKWSPDSKKIIFSDKLMKLYYMDVSSKKVVTVANSDYWEIRNYTWSPDSKWIAYSDLVNRSNPVIHLYSIESGNTIQATDNYFSSFEPEFSSDGKYLFFVSDRTFNPTLGNFEMSYTYNNMSKIYGITLQDTLKSPFIFESDEVVIEDEEKSKSKKKKEEFNIVVDSDNIIGRIFELPLSPGNYSSLKYKNDKLYYIYSSGSKKPSLMSYDFDKKTEDEVGEISAFEISQDGKKIIFPERGEYYIEDLHSKVKAKDGRLNLSDMKVYLDRREEWAQIFDESWRQMRDFFYDPNMHGVDWEKIKIKYSVLLPHVVHRIDLSYIMGEMIGELNIGHAYVGGGDMPSVDNVPIGLLGAEYEIDGSGQAYRITRILKGRNWDENTRSPLTDPGFGIKEGDYILAIDDIKMSEENHPYKALVNKAGKYVKITYNSTSSFAGAKEINVKTIASEDGLRYFNWVEKNREYVEKKTNGKIGYVHIPNMMTDGLNEFVKYFYPQIRKEGLIIDDRYNGGGFVSQMIIERLRRVLTMASIARNQKSVNTYPSAVFAGPMVCLLNELSASDGDIFPYQFRKNGLGKLIGKRSWGGVIGIRGSLPLLDGGYLFKPEFGNFGADSEWILEGVGTDPDIVIDNHPSKEIIGEDEQLDKAIEIILEEANSPDNKGIPDPPKYPIRN